VKAAKVDKKQNINNMYDPFLACWQKFTFISTYVLCLAWGMPMLWHHDLTWVQLTLNASTMLWGETLFGNLFLCTPRCLGSMWRLGQNVILSFSKIFERTQFCNSWLEHSRLQHRSRNAIILIFRQRCKLAQSNDNACLFLGSRGIVSLVMEQPSNFFKRNGFNVVILLNGDNWCFATMKSARVLFSWAM
jgi:hypothetical protein